MIDDLSSIHESILFLSLLFITMIVHEFGHIIAAVNEGKFKGVSFNPLLLVMAVNMTSRLSNRFKYLYGILFSFITLPLWISIGYPLWLTVFGLFLFGIADITVVILWKEVLKGEVMTEPGTN